ncbi:cation:H+ antiporter [Kordia periserrulae]|uniref:Cation:H+ antiporter n=1 Tax=Kordia periserrulae TaxID=701523 RepID=A0A2T6BZI7_9FLAO|nr:sodium:calcium antiporter [Kordia periserrulae]PTX61479.1 cation:H+ antiporter [Kordia periserrulae]
MELLSALGLIIITCIVIWRACDGFEMASDYLGRNLKDGIKGATINAIGSSLPELFTTLFFLFVLKDKDGFSGGIGTTAGSAVFNAMIIPAVVIMAVIGKGIVDRIQISKKVIKRDGISLILCEIVLILLISDTTLDWYHGLTLMILYVIYITYMLVSQGKGSVDDDYEASANGGNRAVAFFRGDFATTVLGNGTMNRKKAWLLLLISIFFIGIACYWLVEACEQFGNAVNMPVYFVSVILASAATSVPDTIISWKDAMKGNYDDAVANALGSNIFDICFALGLPLFLFTIINGPITISNDTLENISQLRVLLLIITIIAFFVYLLPKAIKKSHGYFLITLYVLFVVYIVCKGMDSELAIISSISNLLSSISEVFSSIF